MITSATLTDAIVGTALAPTTHRWTEKDVIVYPLGLGALPPDERHLLDEHVGPAVLPTDARNVVSLRSGMATLAGC